MQRKLVYLVAMIIIALSVSVVGQDFRTYERVVEGTGTLYDTLADTVSTTTNTVSTKVAIYEADWMRGYNATTWSFIISALDTATNSWGYIDSLNKNDSFIIRLFTGQNGYYRQIGTHTTTKAGAAALVLPDTFNIEYGFVDDSLAGMLFDSIWFDVHVYDSVMTTNDSALITVNYMYKLIEFFKGDR